MNCECSDVLIRIEVESSCSYWGCDLVSVSNRTEVWIVVELRELVLLW